MNFLTGYKTYIFGAVIVILSIAYGYKVIDQQTFITLVGIFAGLGGITMRQSIGRALATAGKK